MPTSTRATTLWGLASVKSYIGINDSALDLVVTQIADAVSERIESETNRVFVTRAVSETHDGDGSRRVWLRRFPVVSVASLSAVLRLGDTPTSYTYLTDYDINLLTGELRMRTSALNRGWQNVTAAYTAGFGAQDAATLPADVVQAGLDWVKVLYDKKVNGPVIALGHSQPAVAGDIPTPIRSTIARWRAPQLVGLTR